MLRSFTFIVLLLPLFCFGMKGKGYIITLDGVELSGSISDIYYSDWRSEVTFINDFGRTYVFNAAIIQGFVFLVGDETVEYVSKYKGGNWLFLRVVHQGEKLTLYQSAERKHQIVRETYGYTEKELLAREYWLEFNRRRPFQVYPLTYKKVLKQKFSKHPQLAEKVGEPGWRYQDLLKLVEEYNRLATSNETRL